MERSEAMDVLGWLDDANPRARKLTAAQAEERVARFVELLDQATDGWVRDYVVEALRAGATPTWQSITEAWNRHAAWWSGTRRARSAPSRSRRGSTSRAVSTFVATGHGFVRTSTRSCGERRFLTRARPRTPQTGWCGHEWSASSTPRGSSPGRRLRASGLGITPPKGPNQGRPRPSRRGLGPSVWLRSGCELHRLLLGVPGLGEELSKAIGVAGVVCRHGGTGMRHGPSAGDA